MVEEIFDFLNRKYVQRADGRQKEMGLQYMTAETHDLAKEIGRWVAREMADKDAEIARLRGHLSNLVEAVDVLMAESEGVYGLHLNGDPAPWGELTAGGQFEAWLLALEDARAALEEEQGGNVE